jgi:type IV secretion system protein VirD4
VVVLMVVAGLLFTVFAGAWLAARLVGGEVSGDMGAWMSAAEGLVSAPGDPAGAWGANAAGLPGPVLYWVCTGVVAVVVGAVGVWSVVAWRRSSRVRRVRFGVDGEARQACRGDVAPLVVRSTVPPRGRLLLGRMASSRRRWLGRWGPKGVLLATEDRERHPMRGRAAARQGSRGSVALIGPTQSGKTTLLASAVVTWDGPVIVLSVKRDLYDITASARARRGELAVFDPGGSTKMSTARWTPLRGVNTASGALRAGRSLAAAIPSSGVTNSDYWAQQGQTFVSAYMALAGLSQLLQERGESPLDSPLSIGQLKSWAFSQVGIRDPVVSQLVRLGLEADDLEMNLLAKEACETLLALDKGDARIRDSIFATARTAFQAWGEPSVAHSASLDPRASYGSTQRWARRPRYVDFEWLMSGPGGQANSLYLVAPDTEFERLAPVLGGLLGDFKEQIHAWDIEGRRVDKPFLIVVDEAAQVELTWLPQEVATIAGLGGLFVTCWQSKAQIDHRFRTLADAVLVNHRSKVVFAGCDDPATLDWLKRVTGSEQVGRRGWSAELGSSGRRTVSENVQSEDLLGPHVARQMLPGDGVLIHGTLPPVHLRSVRWWEDPKLKALVPTGADGRPVVPEVETCPMSDVLVEVEEPSRGRETEHEPVSAIAGPVRAETPGAEPRPGVPLAAVSVLPPAGSGGAVSRDETEPAVPLRLVKDRGAGSGQAGAAPVARGKRRPVAETGQLDLGLPEDADGDVGVENRHAGRCATCDRWVLPGQGRERPYGRGTRLVCAPVCPPPAER